MLFGYGNGSVQVLQGLNVRLVLSVLDRQMKGHFTAKEKLINELHPSA
jgi:hypothetical protein